VYALWNNPEFIRHLRAQMRPARTITAVIVSIVLCCLLSLLFYTGSDSASNPSNSIDARRSLYSTLLMVQSLVLCLWCLSSCGQAINSERNLKTFDFLRTTRLTAAEILMGMMFGSPVMAYFVVACTLPFTLMLGWYSGFSLAAMVVTYVMLLILAAVLSLAALTISLLTDRQRSGSTIALLFVLLGWPAITMLIAASDATRFPGFSAVAIVPGLLPLYHIDNPGFQGVRNFAHVPFFNVQVPSLFVSLVLYLTAGAWLVLILLRNLKKDREDIRLLSRWQATGLTAYINLLVFALLDLGVHISNQTGRPIPLETSDIAGGYLGLNFVVLYAIGLGSLTPPARLKNWWRQSVKDLRFYLSDDGLPWVWMAISAFAAFFIFVMEAATSQRFIPFSKWSIPRLAAGLFILLLFAVRDILFLQWCAVKEFRRPVGMGLFFLALYYFACSTLAAFFSKSMLWAGTPIGAFGIAIESPPEVSGSVVLFGVLLQIFLVALLLYAIHKLLGPAELATPTALTPPEHTVAQS
jgi:ABC-2 type transport system permease protein